MAKGSTLGRGLNALLEEIEEYYDNELPKNDRQKEIESEQYVSQCITMLSSLDRKFIESFDHPFKKEAAIKTILHIKGEYKARAKKTHSHDEVVRTIEKIEKDYPHFNVNQKINQTAKALSMTFRAVKEHYYKI